MSKLTFIFTLLLALISGSYMTMAQSTIIVNTTQDELNNDGDCSLREAIEAVNTASDVDNCSVSGGSPYTIELSAGTYTLSLAGAGEDNNQTGDLDIASDVTINGIDAESTIIDGNQLDRVLHVQTGVTVDINEVNIANGKTSVSDVDPFSGNGGGVYNSGTLTLSGSKVSANITGDDNNYFGGFGGGVYNEGTLTLSGSTVSDNTTGNGGSHGGHGGGIYGHWDSVLTINNSTISNNTTGTGDSHGGFGGGIYNSGTLTLSGSTISNNITGAGDGNSHSGWGGGIYSESDSVLTINNSTISDNISGGAAGDSSPDWGGGIFNRGMLTLTNSTISNNTASEGGGIYSWSGELKVAHSTVSHNSQGGGIHTWGDPINLKNTIIAQNQGGGDLSCHGGEFNYYGYNLVQNPGDCTINQVENPGTNITGQDALLGPLANNGGSTQTHALLDGSPAIDAGSCTDIDGNTVSTDQRGQSRPYGATCDIGSFELSDILSTPTPSVTPSPTMSNTPTNPPTATATRTHTPTVTATRTHTPTATVTGTNTPVPTSTSPPVTNTPVRPTWTPPPAPSPEPPVGDAYEFDNACSQASSLPSDGTVQAHTFHSAEDVDWARFEVISGTEYLVDARTPDESQADVVLEVHERCGGVPSFSQGHAFTPDVRLRFTAPQTGSLYLRLNNQDLNAGGNLSYHLSVRALGSRASPGAVVIVAGRLGSDDAFQSNIHEMTNQAYRLFIANGYDSERIYYLATDLSLDADGDGVPDVDAQASRKNLQAAITEWAVDKVSPERAFTLYLMDHGGINKLYLNGENQFVTPDDVDGWLDTLETEAVGVRVNVIVEACHAGSFIHRTQAVGSPQSLSQPGRVVIASTGIYNVAYASENGAFFSDALLSALGRGASLHGAFSEAQWATNQAHPDQTPWLDDDGDGVPNESEDGQEAQVRGFAYAGTLDGEEKWPPYIAQAQIADVSDGDGVISAQVRDDGTLLGVSAIIYKPSYIAPDQDAQEMPQETLPTVALRDADGDGTYRATYEGFDEPGAYRIVIVAVDDEGIEARPKAIEMQLGGHQLYLPLVIR